MMWKAKRLNQWKLSPETSITLPDAEQFSKEGYTFAGWNDGLDTYSPGDSYTVKIATLFSLLNGRKTRRRGSPVIINSRV